MIAQPQRDEATRQAKVLLELLGVKSVAVKVFTPNKLPDQPWDSLVCTITMLDAQKRNFNVHCKVMYLPESQPAEIIRNLMHAIAFTVTVAARDDGEEVWAAVEKHKQERNQRKVVIDGHTDDNKKDGDHAGGSTPQATRDRETPAGESDPL